MVTLVFYLKDKNDKLHHLKTLPIDIIPKIGTRVTLPSCIKGKNTFKVIDVIYNYTQISDVESGGVCVFIHVEG